MPNDETKRNVNLRDVYIAVARSLADANRILDEGDENISYAVVESEFAVAYEHIEKVDSGLQVRLPGDDQPLQQLPTMKFKIKPVPRAEPLPAPSPEVAPTVPNLVGMKLDEGLGALFGAGMRLGRIVYDPSAKPAGAIIDQKPAPRTEAPTDGRVDVHVAGESLTARPAPVRPKPEEKTPSPAKPKKKPR